MNDEQLRTLEEVKLFIEGSQTIEFQGTNSHDKHEWTGEVLKRFHYLKLNKENIGKVVRKCLSQVNCTDLHRI